MGSGTRQPTLAHEHTNTNEAANTQTRKHATNTQSSERANKQTSECTNKPTHKHTQRTSRQTNGRRSRGDRRRDRRGAADLGSNTMSSSDAATAGRTADPRRSDGPAAGADRLPHGRPARRPVLARDTKLGFTVAGAGFRGWRLEGQRAILLQRDPPRRGHPLPQ
jgi:hypothetical protein